MSSSKQSKVKSMWKFQIVAQVQGNGHQQWNPKEVEDQDQARKKQSQVAEAITSTKTLANDV